MTITIHQGDIPNDIDFGDTVAVDGEMMGLNPVRDRLCLLQLSSGDGNAHLVQFKDGNYDAPNLKKLLTDENVTKIFHFGRADIASIWVYLDIITAPVYCTKIASRLARTFTSRHGYKTMCRELLKVDLPKKQDCTDWGVDELTKEQKEYAASDVLYLHKIKEELDAILIREERDGLAESCFSFLPTRALLDAAGWPYEDIFLYEST